MHVTYTILYGYISYLFYLCFENPSASPQQSHDWLVKIPFTDFRLPIHIVWFSFLQFFPLLFVCLLFVCFIFNNYLFIKLRYINNFHFFCYRLLFLFSGFFMVLLKTGLLLIDHWCPKKQRHLYLFNIVKISRDDWASPSYFVAADVFLEDRVHVLYFRRIFDCPKYLFYTISVFLAGRHIACSDNVNSFARLKKKKWF